PWENWSSMNPPSPPRATHIPPNFATDTHWSTYPRVRGASEANHADAASTTSLTIAMTSNSTATIISPRPIVAQTASRIICSMGVESPMLLFSGQDGSAEGQGGCGEC